MTDQSPSERARAWERAIVEAGGRRLPTIILTPHATRALASIMERDGCSISSAVMISLMNEAEIGERR